jgi:uncharacterized protein (TIGR03083 family)
VDETVDETEAETEADVDTGGLVRLNAAAVRASVTVVGKVGDADLGRPTPCAEWTVADLIAHMTIQHEGFAAAAAGEGGDLARWQGARTPAGPPGEPRTPSLEAPEVAEAAEAAEATEAAEVAEALVAEYATAADRVIEAFAVDGIGDRRFDLPEISTAVTFHASQAIGFHLVDYVAHGWDVARSLGLGYDLEPDLLDAALVIARAVPDGEPRLRPGAAFKPRMTAATAAEAGRLDQILVLLGRDPGWTPPLP